jgi:predicted component of type VI protein secretion system
VGLLACAAVVALARLLEQQALARRQMGSRAPALLPVRDVNPLRVARTPEAALQALLAPGVDPQQPLQRAAAELAAHQDRLLAAFQGATQRLGEEMAPESLDAAVAGTGDAARTAQRWELYKGLWQGLGLAADQPWSQGFAEAALLHLAAAYDAQGKA